MSSTGGKIGSDASSQSQNWNGTPPHWKGIDMSRETPCSESQACKETSIQSGSKRHTMFPESPVCEGGGSNRYNHVLSLQAMRKETLTDTLQSKSSSSKTTTDTQ